jgi:exoribonuclease II
MIHIPSNFDNFKQRELSLGLETSSETSYKGYVITLRAYKYSGITAKIIKVLDSGKRVRLREECWNFYIPLDLLNRMKNYIDKYESNLITKLNKLEPNYIQNQK